MKFKVGDVIIGGIHNSVKTVLAVSVTDYMFSLKEINYPLGLSYVETNFKLHVKKIKDTKLARKMYSDYEIDGEYLKVRCR